MHPERHKRASAKWKDKFQANALRRRYQTQREKQEQSFQEKENVLIVPDDFSHRLTLKIRIYI